MKKYTIIYFCVAWFWVIPNHSQTVIPQTIPCVTVTQTNVTGLGSGIAATDCIDTDGNLTFLQYENYSIKAGEYISFGQNTSINPDASHQFHAYIDNGGMEIAWYYPNATPGTVGQFEKLELGVQFREDINTQIQNFVNESGGAQLNPFNPEQVDLYAEFWWYHDGTDYPLLPVGWYGPQRINGFYFEDFVRGTDDWTELPNEHDFRIRFTPRRLGLWKCAIVADIAGHGTLYATDFTFNCVTSTSKDFMRIGESGRYYKIGNEPFFPVGHNLSYPRPTSGCCEFSDPFIAEIEVFEAYEAQLEELAASGANYVRMINNPVTMDIEFEKLNDYSDRMVHAWELDNIFKTCGELELRVHFDLLLQNYFDVPQAFGNFHWDWSAYGDYLNDGDCATPGDPGYCYRAELDLEDPKDFFTDTVAMKFYQYKLRYLIARYGYYTEIALFELQSEVNNVAVYHPKDLLPTGNLDINGNPEYGCFNLENQIYNPYKDSTTGFQEVIYNWQHEMCRYIKEDLQHTNHPLAVSYSGEPKIEWGDQSFMSPFVDIMTYNHYGLLVEKNAIAISAVSKYQNTLAINKPAMFSEFGVGGYESCDQGVDFIKTLVLSPFSGTAGAAMNWDWQYPGQEHLWHHMGPVNQLMSGIPLADEFWTAQPPIVSANKAVEILYLRNFVADNYRAVGAVSNRTYNYYTQGTDIPCTPDILPSELLINTIYQDPQDFEHPIGTESLIIPNMGEEVTYKINWYNALTGEFLGTGQNYSDEDGDFPLFFPLVSGNESRPILFFEIYRADLSSFKNSLVDTLISEKEILPMNSDSAVQSIVATNWEENDIKINITPNPTAEIISVNVESTLNFTWSLYNLIGDQIIKGDIINRNVIIDITNYPSGLYLLKLSDGTKDYTFKIVKS